MRVWKKCVQDSGFGVSFVCFLGMSLYLLTTSSYFSLPELNPDWRFGLYGISQDGTYVSYADYKRKCSVSDPICGFLTDLEKGGVALETILYLCLVLEGLSILHLCLSRYLLTRVILSLDAGLAPSLWIQRLCGVMKWVQRVTLLDPVICVVGVVSWTVQAHLSDIGNRFQMQIEAGLIVLVLKVASTLVVEAILLLFMLENWRNNQAFLEPRKETDQVLKICTEKTVPASFSLEETKL